MMLSDADLGALVRMLQEKSPLVQTRALGPPVRLIKFSET
jgi:hypothetical protein